MSSVLHIYAPHVKSLRFPSGRSLHCQSNNWCHQYHRSLNTKAQYFQSYVIILIYQWKVQWNLIIKQWQNTSKINKTGYSPFQTSWICLYISEWNHSVLKLINISNIIYWVPVVRSFGISFTKCVDCCTIQILVAVACMALTMMGNCLLFAKKTTSQTESFILPTLSSPIAPHVVYHLLENNVNSK